MNNHGSIMFVTIYKVGIGLDDRPVSYATRRWFITHKHQHIACDELLTARTLNAIRMQLRSKYPGAVRLGAYMDDPDNIIETWALPMGDDARVLELVAKR